MTTIDSLPSSKAPSAHFELSFVPTAELVSVVRRFVTGFYDRMLDGDTAARLAMATHELLENTVKYSTDGRASMSIDLQPDGGDSVLSICTRNRARAEDVALLARMLDEMGAAEDSQHYYQALLRRNIA